MMTVKSVSPTSSCYQNSLWSFNCCCNITTEEFDVWFRWIVVKMKGWKLFVSMLMMAGQTLLPWGAINQLRWLTYFRILLVQLVYWVSFWSNRPDPSSWSEGVGPRNEFTTGFSTLIDQSDCSILISSNLKISTFIIAFFIYFIHVSKMCIIIIIRSP